MSELIKQAHKDMNKLANGGKGDRQRPTDKDAYEDAWERIWGAKDESEVPEVPSDSNP